MKTYWFLLSLFICPGCAAPEKQGDAAYEAGDYRTAIAKWERRIEVDKSWRKNAEDDGMLGLYYDKIAKAYDRLGESQAAEAAREKALHYNLSGYTYECETFGDDYACKRARELSSAPRAAVGIRDSGAASARGPTGGPGEATRHTTGSAGGQIDLTAAISPPRRISLRDITPSGCQRDRSYLAARAPEYPEPLAGLRRIMLEQTTAEVMAAAKAAGETQLTAVQKSIAQAEQDWAGAQQAQACLAGMNSNRADLDRIYAAVAEGRRVDVNCSEDGGIFNTCLCQYVAFMWTDMANRAMATQFAACWR